MNGFSGDPREASKMMRPLAICRLAIAVTLLTSVLLLFYHSKIYRYRVVERDPWASRKSLKKLCHIFFNSYKFSYDLGYFTGLMRIVLPKASKAEKVSALPMAVARVGAGANDESGGLKFSILSSGLGLGLNSSLSSRYHKVPRSRSFVYFICHSV